MSLQGTRLFVGVSADRPMEVEFTEADGPGEGFFSGADYDALDAAYQEAITILRELRDSVGTVEVKEQLHAMRLTAALNEASKLLRRHDGTA